MEVRTCLKSNYPYFAVDATTPRSSRIVEAYSLMSEAIGVFAGCKQTAVLIPQQQTLSEMKRICKAGMFATSIREMI